MTLTFSLGKVDRPVYVRLRGTDGNRSAPGYLGAAVDPTGPAIDVVGDADPWADLWFYANPIFVVTPSPCRNRASRDTTVDSGSYSPGVDTPLTTLAETEHVLLGLGQRVELPADAFVCTHMVR